MVEATMRIRVPFHDVDSSGRIHFTAVLRYMEIAEHELMRSIGFPYARMLLDTLFPRVHVECDFCSTVRYDDMLLVNARVDRVGRSSWTDAFTIYHMLEARTDGQNDGDALGKTVAQGRITIVAIDPTTERARPLPDDLRHALTEE